MKTDKQKYISEQRRDKEWKWFNEKVTELMKSNDFYGLGSIYYEMADFVKKEGKDNTYLLQLGFKMKLKFQNNRLMDYKRSDICTGVEIIAVTNSPGNNSCETCLQLDGKIFPIDEALLNNPLPVKNCSHEYGCRCVYGPAFD